MPLAEYYVPPAGEKYLQKDSRRLPASCNASLVHCLRTNVSTMFWANKLLYSQAIWCRKRQSWRSRVRLNAASGSVREWFIWNYCCALLQRVVYWCVRLKWLLQEGEIGERELQLSSTGHRLLSLHFISLSLSSAFTRVAHVQGSGVPGKCIGQRKRRSRVDQYLQQQYILLKTQQEAVSVLFSDVFSLTIQTWPMWHCLIQTMSHWDASWTSTAA